MTDRTVNVTLLADGRVSTAQNPLTVVPGDTVTWRFVNREGEIIDNAMIDFRGFMPMSRITPLTGPQQQPFTVRLSGPSLKTGPFTVASTDRGLYFYVILLNADILEWEVPLFTVGNFSPFFGGIIIRDPPSGGG